MSMKVRVPVSAVLSTCAFVLLMTVVCPRSAQAQVESWSNPSGGFWDDFRNWSLGVHPTNSDTVFITNAPSKTVTIDSFTSGTYPDSMTISDLTVLASGNVTNTLSLSDAGTNTPLQIHDTLMILSGGALLMADSSLLVGDVAGANFALEAPASFSGTNFLSGGIAVGYSTNSVGSISMGDGQTAFTNGYTVIGFYGSAQVSLSNGILQDGDDISVLNSIFFGFSSGSQGLLSLGGGIYLAPEDLSLGMYAGSTGLVWVTGGQLIQTNNLLTTIGGDGVGRLVLSNGQVLASQVIVADGTGSQGTLVIAGGTVNFSGGLAIGIGETATGIVSITDGQLAVTNRSVIIGNFGIGQMTVSNGALLAQSMVVGNCNLSQGSLTIAGGVTSIASNMNVGVYSNANGIVQITGGVTSISSNLTLGVFSNATGLIQITGGNLAITNQFVTGQLVVGQIGSGTFAQSGGVVTVDQLLAINSNKSVFGLSSGVFNAKSTTVNNTRTFVVGDGIDAATYHLLGGVHSFANGLEVRSNAVLSGCGTINGSVVVDAGGAILAACGGTQTFTGIVTNNGSWSASNGTVLESYASVVNNGVINAIDGSTNFHGGFINNGVVLDRSDLPRIVSISRVGPDVGILFTTFSNLTHLVEYTTNLTSASWTPLVTFTGSGGTTNVTDMGAATLSQRFYRVHLVVPQ
jgi:hypothetical protein